MPTYVLLLNWTEQGVRNVRESVDRYEQAQPMFEQRGVTLRDAYWTVGPYDLVAMAEAPDDETMSAAALALASQGNVRSTTMRAFSADEMRGVLQRLG